MVDYTQILISAVVIVLTILLIFIGIKIYQILDELLKATIKTNRMLDNAENLSNEIGRSVKSISGFAEGLKAVFKLIHLFSKDKKNE
jgi:hypothetical protein